MGGPSQPPSEGMIETMTATWHADDGPGVRSFAESAVGPMWARNIYTTLDGKVGGLRIGKQHIAARASPAEHEARSERRSKRRAWDPPTWTGEQAGPGQGGRARVAGAQGGLWAAMQGPGRNQGNRTRGGQPEAATGVNRTMYDTVGTADNG